MYTDGVLCTMFFSHIYPTVHDKVRSMTNYAALLCNAPETCHRLAAFHETIELSRCAKTNNNDNVHDLGSFRRDP